MSNCVAFHKSCFKQVRHALVGFLVMVVMPFSVWANDEEVTEAALKAAYAYNFTQFINWPETDAETRFRFCVITAKEEMQAIFNHLNGRNVGQQVIEVVYAPEDVAIAQLASCQLIFQPEPLSISLPSLHKGTVLVAFNPAKDDSKVSIVMYFNRDGKLRFSVNQTALSEAGVDVSSQLLKLASGIRGKVNHG